MRYATVCDAAVRDGRRHCSLATVITGACAFNLFDESQRSISPAQSTNIGPRVILQLYSEAYAASWGSQIISMEVGENILHTQSKASPQTL